MGRNSNFYTSKTLKFLHKNKDYFNRVLNWIILVKSYMLKIFDVFVKKEMMYSSNVCIFSKNYRSKNRT